ncbi:MAG: hypothetical protein R2704_14215, partial [Microthrixaceae bacterium]
GMDPDELERLAAAVRAAGGTVEGADTRLRGRLKAVSWVGDDAVELRRAFDVAARAGGRLATAELRATADRLEAQAREQRQASGQVAAGPGGRIGEVRTTAVGPGDGVAPEAPAPPMPVNVVTETRVVGVEAGASPADARATATLTLSVAEDGTAQVSVGADQRLGALLGQASGGAGVGLTGSRELALSFADEAGARRFVEQMTEALTPNLELPAGLAAPGPLVLGLGLGVPALVLGGGRSILDEVGREAAGVLVANAPTGVDGSVGASADVWGSAALDRFNLDADVARGATYHPADGTWSTTTTLGAAAVAPVLGDVKADLGLETSISTTIGPEGVTGGTWVVEATGGGAAGLGAMVGLATGGPGVDLGDAGRVRFEARLPADDPATRAALNEFNRGVVAPHRAAATLERMVGEGELSITVEQRSASDDGRSYGPVRVISERRVTSVERLFRRAPGGGWVEVDLRE